MLLPACASASPAGPVVARALAEKLYEAPAWAALTHSENGEPSIRGSSFLLSAEDYTPERELVATIELLYGGDARDERKCRFPARNEWLAAQLGIEPASLAHCVGLQEYLEKVPVDEIVLVYASENLSQPSSMMGHILIKFVGNDANGIRREHAVSFFTEIEGINVPKIVFDSLVVGKKGYFTLSPYQKKLAAYLAGEQRNVWEYALSLSASQRRIVQLHVWELKTANPTYFFDDYNCATLTQYVLATANPALLGQGRNMVTPLDVVKNVAGHGMIAETSVLPSSKWRIRMISGSLPGRIDRDVKDSVDSGDAARLPEAATGEEGFLVRTLASSYNDYLYETDQRTQADWSRYAEGLRSGNADRGDYVIDLSQYKSPLKTPPDGQWYGGFAHVDDGSHLKIGLLPVSHTLSEDNSQFFSETELRLADLSILLSTDDGTVDLNEFQLYSASSFLPRNLFTGGLSGRFEVGIEPHYDESLERKLAGNVSGALGMTWEPVGNLYAYAVMNAGLGYRAGQAYLYAAPEFGMIAKEAHGMKTILAISETFGQIDSGDRYGRFTLLQSIRLDSSWTVAIDGNYLASGGETEIEFGVTLKYLF